MDWPLSSFRWNSSWSLLASFAMFARLSVAYPSCSCRIASSIISCSCVFSYVRASSRASFGDLDDLDLDAALGDLDETAGRAFLASLRVSFEPSFTSLSGLAAFRPRGEAAAAYRLGACFDGALALASRALLCARTLPATYRFSASLRFFFMLLLFLRIIIFFEALVDSLGFLLMPLTVLRGDTRGCGAVL